MKNTLTILAAVAMLTIELHAAQKASISAVISSSGSAVAAETMPKVTPESICAEVRRRVDYVRDEVDEWPSAGEVLARGYGDCEDFAACIVELCGRAGIEAEIVVVETRRSSYSHAIVVGTWNGRMWMASNGRYTDVDDMTDVGREVAREGGWRRRDVTTMPLLEYIERHGAPSGQQLAGTGSSR